MELNNNFIIGLCIGSVQTIVGYPFDMIKSNMQFRKTNMNNIFKNKVGNIYRGIGYPLLGSAIINSSVFGFYQNYYNITNNHFIAGMIAGGTSSIIITPIEVCKIQIQVDKNNSLRLLNNGLIFKQNLYRAFPLTLLIESMSTSAYFGLYNKFKENNYNIFLSGGISGVISWGIIYPLDTIKTRLQGNNKLSYIEAIKTKHFFNGFSMCMSRAFIVNGVSFFLYDKIKNYIDN